ncbi:MAG: phosphopantetheine-binding protein [Pseudomonadales bacterium]
MTQLERLEKLSPAQRQLLIEQLHARRVFKQRQGRSQLVAVVSGCGASKEQYLSEHLSTTLPDYMLPSQWHFLDELPRNANGKLDRQVLARQLTTQSVSVQSSGKSSGGSGKVAESESERQQIEQALSAIWAEVLFMDEVQLDDDYFELGGDSIASMQIVARAGKQDLEFSTQDIMRFPNIRQLTQRLISLRNDTGEVAESSTEHDTDSIADVMRVLNLGDQ